MTRPTRREAIDAAARLRLQLSGQSGAIWQSPTVAEAVAERIRTADWSATLLDEYSRAQARIPADLAALRLDSVTVPAVERAYARLAGDGVGVYPIRRVHELLRSTFAEAVRVGALEVSPMANVRPPAKPDRDVHPPSPQQVRAILDHATPGPARVALSIAAHTAMRRGEIVALRWGDVDLEQQRIRIVRSHAYTPTAGVHERPTKTGLQGQRTVSIDRQLVDELAVWRAAQCETAIANMLGRPIWVIASGIVEPWRPDRLTHEFAAACRRANIRGVRLHDLRHFVATQLLAAGVPPSRVAAMLGHTSTATTERIYRHWLPGEDADLAAMIGRITRGA